MAVNLPIQGTQADLIKMAMISVHKHLKDKYLKDEAKMLLQIHDELVFEIKENSVQEISKEIKKIMESMYKLKVPIIVDAKEGDNWAEMERMRF
jgi:DNA polymerase-1